MFTIRRLSARVWHQFHLTERAREGSPTRHSWRMAGSYMTETPPEASFMLARWIRPRVRGTSPSRVHRVAKEGHRLPPWRSSWACFSRLTYYTMWYNGIAERLRRTFAGHPLGGERTRRPLLALLSLRERNKLRPRLYRVLWSASGDDLRAQRAFRRAESASRRTASPASVSEASLANSEVLDRVCDPPNITEQRAR
jgi:hypothetical protein